MRKISSGIKIGIGVFFSLLFAGPVFLQEYFGQMDFEQILFVMISDGTGADLSIVVPFLVFSLPFIGLFAMFVCLYRIVRQYRFEFHYSLFKKRFHTVFDFERSLKKTIMSLICAILILGIFINAQLNISGYVSGRMNPGLIYEEYYVNPNDVEIKFPEEKRNLVYIVLESMNNNFTSTRVEGSTVNLIPDLERLALGNLNFSNSEGLGGHVQVRGLTWTVASLVGQTAGVPLQIPIGRNAYGTSGIFLPGITTLGEILEDNGYANYFLMGSDGDFGGRQTYFETHGNYQIYDTKYLKDIGYISEDYHVFWGMEDNKLFEFAKMQLTEIAAKDEPFNFSMLTVDTHYPDGYTDIGCPNPYSDIYANAYACSNIQVTDFIEWLKVQDFYENTTVILVGDHATMNNEFIQQTVSSYQTLYNTFMNVNIEYDESVTKMRKFSALDFFPTTIVALGGTIEGDQLGLGVNLFSGNKTMLEKLGLDEFNDELGKKSLYYEQNFFR